MNLPGPLVLAGAAVAGLSAYALAPARGVGTGPAAVPPLVVLESGAAPSPARKWVDEVFAANARELERLVFAENALPEPDTSKLEILLLRWGEREPARCLESLPLLKSPEEFRELLIGDWASRDPACAR